MESLVDENSLMEYLGRPLLVIHRGYKGTRDLVPLIATLGILELGVHQSLWVRGPRLKVRDTETRGIYYQILGETYILSKPSVQTPVPLHQTEVYSFPDDLMGLTAIEKIRTHKRFRAIA